MDLFLKPHCTVDVVESLLHHVFGMCKESGCMATMCLAAPGSRKMDLLRRAGFWVVPAALESQPFPFTVREHAVPVSDLTVENIEAFFGILDIL